MSRWDEVLARADVDTAASTADEVLLFRSTVDDAVAQRVVTEWFGEDDDRAAVRVVVDGVDRGLLHRGDAHALVGSQDRGLTGGYGTSARLDLPGMSTQYVVLHLACPLPQCAVRASALSYDPDDAPDCPVHGQPLVRVPG